MPRFVRGQPEGEADDQGLASSAEHHELIELVNAYCEPLVPDPQSPLSAREQHLAGICRPRRVRDVAWHRMDPHYSNGRYPT
jgi:hypothetical protein